MWTYTNDYSDDPEVRHGQPCVCHTLHRDELQ